MISFAFGHVSLHNISHGDFAKRLRAAYGFQMNAKIKRDDGIAAAFAEEQRRGLSAALYGRLGVLLVIGTWIGTTRFPPTVYYMVGLIALFAVIGLAQIWAVRRYGVKAWQLYLFMLIEVSILVVAIAVFSAPFTADLPVTLGFRFGSFAFFFLFVASAAFSYAPGLVLWSGASVVIAWGLASVWVQNTNEVLGWTDLPTNPTAEQFLEVFLHPMFFGIGSRMQESLVLMSVAGLLAIVAWRARRVVYRQAQAERERAQVADVFGQYVPEVVADRLIADAGALEPQEVEATILMTDIKGFTSLSENMAPADVLAMLDDYFDRLGQLVAAEGGVVGQFHGDAVIASFNVPVADPNHAAAAIRAGLAIEAAMETETFRGQELHTRIGINTGPVVAGSVGSQGRRSYTVYGDTVNAAARIEAVNKEFGTTLLVSGSTADAAGSGFDFEPLGDVTMRGRSEPTQVYRPLTMPALPAGAPRDSE